MVRNVRILTDNNSHVACVPFFHLGRPLLVKDLLRNAPAIAYEYPPINHKS